MWNLCGFSLVFSLFLIALVKFIKEGEVSRCEMTYMYEEPQYIRMQLNESVRTKYPAYNLYLYGEGFYAQWLREHNYMGIPVLFLPGNSGSYKQVRSLASVSLTKASKGGGSLHFNYFSVDFNEEFSAFYGKVLFTQTEYAAICVEHILSLYEGRPSRPTSVLIIGHSMGGLVARALLTLPHFDSSFVNSIITLATPNLKPVAQPDSYVVDFYDKMNSVWMEKRRADGLNHINLVSIGGGNRDLMVRSDLVRMPRAIASDTDIVTLTTAIPGVWTSTDHLCMVWCNQLMLSIVRATFKLVDRATGQISSDANRRTLVFRDFLVSGIGRAHKLALPKEGTTLVADGSWKNVGPDKRRYVAKSRAAPSSALLLALRKGKDFVMVSTGFDMEPWILTCNDPQQLSGSNDTDPMTLCKVHEDFSHKSLYVPVGKRFWKIFACDWECGRKVRKFVVKLPSEQKNVSIYTETFASKDRSRTVRLSDLLLWNADFSVPDKSIFFRIALSDMTEPWQAYHVGIDVSGSGCPALVGSFHFYVPGSNEDAFRTIYNKTTSHVVRLFTSRNSTNESFPELRFYVHPDCKCEIVVRFSLLDSLEQVVRFHAYWLPAFLTAALLQLLSKQFAALSKTGECSSCARSLSFYGDFVFLVKVYLLGAAFGYLSKALAVPILSPSFSVPTISAFFIAYFLYVSAGTTVAVVAGAVSLCTMFLGKMLALLLGFFRLVDTSRQSPASMISVLGPIGLSFVSLLLSAKTCGGVGLLAVQVISGIKLLHSHLQFWRSSGRARARGSMVERCLLSVTFYLFWGILFQLNCPALIFWIKNITYEQHLDPDPSFVSALVVIVAFFGRGEARLRSDWHRKQSYRVLSIAQQVFSAIILLFALDRIYLISWVLAFDAAAMTVWHWVVHASIGEKHLQETARGKGDKRKERRTQSEEKSTTQDRTHKDDRKD